MTYKYPCTKVGCKELCLVCRKDEILKTLEYEKKAEQETTSDDVAYWERDFEGFSVGRGGYYSGIYGDLGVQVFLSNSRYRCSKCGFPVKADIFMDQKITDFHYCPGCASHMEAEPLRRHDRRMVEFVIYGPYYNEKRDWKRGKNDD